MKPAALTEELDDRLFGGKAAQLAAATRAGLPVPAGVALPFGFVDAVGGRRPRSEAAARGDLSHARRPARGTLVRGR